MVSRRKALSECNAIMPLLQGDRIQFLILLCCVPVQYLLTNNIGNETTRTKLVIQLVNDLKSQYSLLKKNIVQCVSLVLNGKYYAGKK